MCGIAGWFWGKGWAHASKETAYFAVKSHNMSALPSPLTPAQIEILKVLARPMAEDELLELKRLLVRHFARKLTQQANEVWDANGWTAKDTAHLRQRHLRTHSPSFKEKLLP